MKKFVKTFPIEHRETLYFINSHLIQVVNHANKNKMSLDILSRTWSICFGDQYANFFRIAIEFPEVCPSTKKAFEIYMKKFIPPDEIEQAALWGTVVDEVMLYVVDSPSKGGIIEIEEKLENRIYKMFRASVTEVKPVTDSSRYYTLKIKLDGMERYIGFAFEDKQGSEKFLKAINKIKK